MTDIDLYYRMDQKMPDYKFTGSLLSTLTLSNGLAETELPARFESWLCSACGAFVADKELHDKFHSGL